MTACIGVEMYVLNFCKADLASCAQYLNRHLISTRREDYVICALYKTASQLHLKFTAPSNHL